ncbi:FliM/FliN family flagellar motor switch protein [Deltaproteobacteria bacterium TL4]
MVRKTYADVQPYDIISSHIESGRFQWLDVVMHRWAYLLETTFFDTLGVIFEVQPQKVEWKAFETFLKEFKEQQPIYIFETEAHGKGLLVVENKFAHSCLYQNPKKLLEDQPSHLPALDSKKQAKLHWVLKQVLSDFEKSWLGIAEMHLFLKRVTTHPFRARVMRPFEKCVIAKLLFRTHGFESNLTLCFPYIALDPIFHRLERKKILPPDTLEHNYPEVTAYFKKLLEQTEYQLTAELGTIEIGPQHNQTTLQKGQIFPIHSLVGKEVTLRINNTALLTGEVGESEDNYAIRVLGSYEEKKLAYRKRARTFKSAHWPSAS